MYKILRTIIFMCLIACVCSRLVSKTLPENLPERGPDMKTEFFGWIKDTFHRVIESLKNPSGPNVNPNNICVWKICSKPLRQYRGESFKDVTTYKQNSPELNDLIKGLNVVSLKWRFFLEEILFIYFWL